MEIEFWLGSNKHNYVDNFIRSQSKQIKRKILRDLELIKKYGHFEHTKKIRGYNLYEIKIKSCRIFCTIKGSTCWLLHGFIKKSNKTPIKELETANKRLEDLNIYLLGKRV